MTLEEWNKEREWRKYVHKQFVRNNRMNVVLVAMKESFSTLNIIV